MKNIDYKVFICILGEGVKENKRERMKRSWFF